MTEDVLKEYPVEQVAAWYGRLADGWSRNMPELQPALAGLFLKTWLENRNPSATIAFDAPPHLRMNGAVLEVQMFHRDVFLTVKKARFTGGSEKWAGILPRAQGLPGFSKWDMQSPLPLEYESLCDIAPNAWAIAKIQRSGSNGDRDIFGSLRGFQLKSKATVIVAPSRPGDTGVTIQFQSWTCSGTDRYDWDYNEYLTVVNPDFDSKEPDAIRPKQQTLTVFHKNAKRLEDAKLAAPYNVELRPWSVADPRVVGPATIDPARRL